MRGFDSYNLRRELSNTRNELEKFDMDSHIDRTLSFSENRQNIRSMFGMNHGGETRRAMEGSRRPTHGEFDQTGRSNRDIDILRDAKTPGFRRTDWGTSYTERRRNRSDRPGGRL